MGAATRVAGMRFLGGFGLRTWRWRRVLLMAGVLGLPAVTPAYAAAPKQDQAAVQALRKAQGLLRQLSQEKTALETEKAALLEQVKKLEASIKQLEPLQDEVKQLKVAVEALKQRNSSLESQVSSGNEREQALRGKLKEVIAQAKQIQGDNRLLVEAVKEREQWISQCTEKNRGMFEANRELLQHYQNKGFWDKVSEAEPFTGIGKVKAENREQEYRFKLEDLQVTPFRSEEKGLAEDARAAAPAPEPAPEDDEDDEDEPVTEGQSDGSPPD